MIYDELGPMDMVRNYFLSVKLLIIFYLKLIDLSFIFGLTKKSNTLKPSNLKPIQMCP